jgi:hypothetical protein
MPGLLGEVPAYCRQVAGRAPGKRHNVKWYSFAGSLRFTGEEFHKIFDSDRNRIYNVFVKVLERSS